MTTDRSVQRARARRCLRTWVPVVLAGLGLAGAAGAAEIAFDPERIYVDHPGILEVALNLESADEVRGYEITVLFDGELLEFSQASPGALFAGFPGVYWSVTPGVNQVEIELIVPPDECAQGPGELLSLAFTTATERGEGLLSIGAVTLRDCAGFPIEPVTTGTAMFMVGPEADLYFTPDPYYVYGPEPFAIPLCVGVVDSLRAYQIYLTYDPAVLHFDSASVGALMTPDPPLPIWWHYVEEGPTLVRVECSLLGPGLFVDGPGELARLHFTALIDPETTEIGFDAWHVYDVDTVEFYPVAIDPGTIIIDAMLQEAAPAELPPGRLSLQLAGGQTNPGQQVGFRCRSATAPQARVCDALGRLVRRLTPRPAGDGHYDLRWDGRDCAGGRVASGVYLLRVTDGKESTTARVVVVR